MLIRALWSLTAIEDRDATENLAGLSVLAAGSLLGTGGVPEPRPNPLKGQNQDTTRAGTCFEARITRDGKPDLTARFGGIPLVQKKDAILADRAPGPAPYLRKELIYRLLTRRCELRGAEGKVLLHQVRKLASLGKPGPGQPAWAAKLAKIRRKTLIVHRACHDAIHGHPAMNTAYSLESHVR